MKETVHTLIEREPEAGDQIWFYTNEGECVADICEVDGNYVRCEFDVGIGKFKTLGYSIRKIDSYGVSWDTNRQMWRASSNMRYRNGIIIPKEVEDFAKKHKLHFVMSEWFSDKQHYGDWHRNGSLYYSPLSSDVDLHPDQAIWLKEHRDSLENTIRLEVYLCERRGVRKGNSIYFTKEEKGDYLYKKTDLIYEWRDNGGFKGVYMPLPPNLEESKNWQMRAPLGEYPNV